MLNASFVFATASIASAWLASLGTAYLFRFKIGAALPITLGAVGACYLALALCAFLILGFDDRGALAAAGLLVPATVASVLAAFRR